jgi:hypothetical protein
MRTVRLLVSLAAVTLALAAASPARADIDPEVRAGVYTDGSDGFIGGGVLWDLGQRGRWYANPNLEYVLVDNGDYFTINGDVHYDLDVDTPFFVWAGGGPALLFADSDRGDSETDIGLNLIAGIGARQGNIRPFAQLKLIVSDDSQLVFAVGLRF